MANYADTNAAKLVAAHIIGKSIITAPLEMGEDIADIGGPAHDSASFGSRLTELAATGRDGKAAKLINNWGTNVLNSVLTDKTLFCVPETMYEIFDTIFYSVSQDKLVKKSYAELITSDDDDSYLNLIPVGIIIIPTRLDVYGDGSALMASIRPLDPHWSARYHWTGEYWDSDYNQFITDSDWIDDVTHIYDHNPQHSQSIGALSYGMYWANYSKAISWRFYRPDPTGIIDNFDNSYKVIPACGAAAYTSWITTSPDSRCENITTGHVYTGYDENGNASNYMTILPIIRSASIDSVSGDLRTYDTNTEYTKEKIASPIATDASGKRSLNPNFFTPASWTVNNNTWKNALTDFDGYANTQKLQKLNEGYDWKTIAEHQSGGKDSQLNLPDPISAKIWEFYTPGTNRGDWYIPSLGEMAFATIFLSKQYEIPQGNVLTKLINIYSTLGVTYLPTDSKWHKTNVLQGTNNAGAFLESSNYWLTSTVNTLTSAWGDYSKPGYWLTNSYHGGISQPFWDGGWHPSVLPVMRIR